MYGVWESPASCRVLRQGGPSLVAGLLGECKGRLNQHAPPMVKAAVNAKVNFSTLYLISEMVAGSPYKVVSSLLRVSYQGTKFCFSLYCSFKRKSVKRQSSYAFPPFAYICTQQPHNTPSRFLIILPTNTPSVASQYNYIVKQNAPEMTALCKHPSLAGYLQLSSVDEQYSHL